MNKANAIKALENGATLHINHNTDKCWICAGASVSDLHNIRRATADQIAEMPFLNGFSSFNGVSVHSVKK